MKFQRRPGVSVIIATLLLIAIAVAAGIIVYVFVNGLAGSLTSGGGQQTTERLQMQSFTFAVSPPVSGGFTCGCSGQLLDIFLINSGSSSTTISAVYYDGTILTIASPFTTAAAFPGATTAYTAPFGTFLQSGTANGDFGFNALGAQLTYATSGATSTGQVVIAFPAAVTAGTTHTVKIVSSTGATNILSVTAGRTG